MVRRSDSSAPLFAASRREGSRRSRSECLPSASAGEPTMPDRLAQPPPGGIRSQALAKRARTIHSVTTAHRNTSRDAAASVHSPARAAKGGRDDQGIVQRAARRCAQDLAGVSRRGGCCASPADPVALGRVDDLAHGDRLAAGLAGPGSLAGGASIGGGSRGVHDGLVSCAALTGRR